MHRWKAAAIGQSGFKEAADFYGRMRLIFGPPYKGVAATIFGMTWARAAIFYGSDVGKERLLQHWRRLDSFLRDCRQVAPARTARKSLSGPPLPAQRDQDL